MALRELRVLAYARAAATRPLTLLWLAGAFACASPDLPTLPVLQDRVTSVVLTAPSTSVGIGASVQLTVQALGKSGQQLNGRTIQWSTSNPAVASVSESGVVTGIAPGNATVRASADGAIGEVALTVEVNRCANPLVMSVGEVRLISGPEAVGCVTLGASGTANDYLVIAANATPSQDDIRLYTLSAAGATTSSAPTDAVADRLAIGASATGTMAPASEAFEDGLRRYEQALVGARDVRALRADAEPRASRLVAAAETAVGDTLPFRVLNTATGDPCANFASVRAVVKSIGRKVIVAQDVASPSGGFSDADFASITSEFDNLIYPTDTLWFGSPSDVDGNGKIIVLFTPEVNKLTPSGSSSYVAGFFFLGDLLARSIPSQGYTCNASNLAEIFYLLSPDPRGDFNNVRTTSEVRQGTRGTLGHEFQHMINMGVRLRNSSSLSEAVWLQEAMAHFAEEAVGRASRGFGDFQRLSYADVSSNANDYNAFFKQNLIRFKTWTQRPDTASPISRKAGPNLAPRGAAWALVRYAADQFSGGDAKGFFRKLTAGPETDVANLVKAAAVPFDTLLAGFLITNFTPEASVAGLSGRYDYKSWRMRDALSGISAGTFPLFVTSLPGVVTTQSPSGSGNYFRVTRAGGVGVTMKMQTPGGAPVDFPYARLYIVRLN